MRRVLHLHCERLGPLGPPDDDGDPDLVNTAATCAAYETEDECSV